MTNRPSTWVWPWQLWPCAGPAQECPKECPKLQLLLTPQYIHSALPAHSPLRSHTRQIATKPNGLPVHKMLPNLAVLLVMNSISASLAACLNALQVRFQSEWSSMTIILIMMKLYRLFVTDQALSYISASFTFSAQRWPLRVTEKEELRVSACALGHRNPSQEVFSEQPSCARHSPSH